jgi:7-cyano-7-deazaguanine synthase
MCKYDRVLLFSGGVDSFCAYYYLNKPQTVYFDLRTRYSHKELKYIKNAFPNTIIDDSLDLRSREIGDKAYVPFRNLLIACQAAHYSDTIIIAGLKDDKVSDKNEEVFVEMSCLLSKMEGRQINVTSPFWQHTKAEVVRWYLEDFGGTPSDLVNTVSCYSATSTSYCGQCPCCFRKWCALTTNGISMPFFNNELMDSYYQAAKAGAYVIERNQNIIEAVDAYSRRH